ncbi:MAG: hypothetical protein IPK19_33115 [Chloroflexi bacterium]|nr:hypothetical protein [Chloroflexota bacterium]
MNAPVAAAIPSQSISEEASHLKRSVMRDLLALSDFAGYSLARRRSAGHRLSSRRPVARLHRRGADA